MICAAERMAERPLPQRRLTVSAEVSIGKPPFSAATRAMYISLASVWITLPKTQAPISFGASPERRTASRVTAAANSVGGMSLSAPPYLPTAVRTALKTTTSRYIISVPLRYSFQVKFTGDALRGAFQAARFQLAAPAAMRE